MLKKQRRSRHSSTSLVRKRTSGKLIPVISLLKLLRHANSAVITVQEKKLEKTWIIPCSKMLLSKLLPLAQLLSPFTYSESPCSGPIASKVSVTSNNSTGSTWSFSPQTGYSLTGTSQVYWTQGQTKSSGRGVLKRRSKHQPRGGSSTVRSITGHASAPGITVLTDAFELRSHVTLPYL